MLIKTTKFILGNFLPHFPTILILDHSIWLINWLGELHSEAGKQDSYITTISPLRPSPNSSSF